MPLLKNGKPATDVWAVVTDPDSLPDDDHLIVEGAVLIERGGVPEARAETQWGVAWPNDRPVADLVPYLDQLSLVTLTFPTFKDGRAYSQARLLREHFGFVGEIRATGQVQQDQFAFMVRAGFDALQVTRDTDMGAFDRAVAAIPIVYQPGADDQMTAFRARIGNSGASKAGVRG